MDLPGITSPGSRRRNEPRRGATPPHELVEGDTKFGLGGQLGGQLRLLPRWWQRRDIEEKRSGTQPIEIMSEEIVPDARTDTAPSTRLDALLGRAREARKLLQLWCVIVGIVGLGSDFEKQL